MSRSRFSRANSRGAALAVVLVLTAAGMALSSAVATSAALELAMSGQSVARQRALEAAEAGIAAALRAQEWSAAGPWSDSGTMSEGGTWQVELRLTAARIDPSGAPVDWHFEIESRGRDGAARVTLVQGFRVLGELPGEVRLSWWRQAEPEA
jgi:hypothetical protein